MSSTMNKGLQEYRLGKFLEKKGIVKDKIDLHSSIDSDLHYYENKRELKKKFGLKENEDCDFEEELEELKEFNHKERRKRLRLLALEWYGKGFTPVPFKLQLDSKGKEIRTPVIEWGEWKEKRPSSEVVMNSWFNRDFDQIGLFCGPAHNMLVVLDVDDPSIYQKYFKDIKTYVERTPHGGYHLFFIIKSKILRAIRYNSLPIDILGEGSLCLIAPSFDLKGRCWEAIRDVPILVLDDLSQILDRLPKPCKQRPNPIEHFKKSIDFQQWIRKNFEVKYEGKGYLQIHCPFPDHPDKYTPSMTVYPDTYYCYGCGRHGDIIDFVQNWKGIGFKEALKELGYKGEFANKELEDIHLSKVESVRVYPTKVCWVRLYKGKEKKKIVEDERTVLKGHFEASEKFSIDDNTLYKVKLDKVFIGNAEEIINKIRREGLDVSKAHLNDTVKAILTEIKDKREGHGTVGVYEDGESLEFCKDPIPYTEQQRYALRELKRGKVFDYEPNPEDLRAYLKLISFWHPYEIYPLMGLSLVAPFSPILKPYGYLFPVLFNWDPTSNIGKSLTGKIFSDKLYGIHGYGSEKLDSSYRLQSMLDSACLPILFEEGEKFSFTKYSIIKDACEYYPLTGRGRPDLTEVNYYARALPIFTGNYLNLKSPTYMVRFFVVHFDGKAKYQRQKARAELNALVSKLKPIGFWIIESALDWLKAKAKEKGLAEKDLLKNMLDKIEEELNKYNQEWEDSRRPGSWTLCYFGLKLWELGANKLGIEWEAPPMEDFAKEVIAHIEQSSFENVELPAKAFIDWWEGWKVKNAREHQTYQGEYERIIRGRGEIWKEGPICVDEKKIDGEWITNTLIQEYEKDRARSELPPIGSMKNLAEGISSLSTLPVEDIYGEEGKVQRFEDKTKRAVFIPFIKEKEEKSNA